MKSSRFIRASITRIAVQRKRGIFHLKKNGIYLNYFYVIYISESPVLLLAVIWNVGFLTLYCFLKSVLDTVEIQIYP